MVNTLSGSVSAYRKEIVKQTGSNRIKKIGVEEYDGFTV